MILSDNPEQTSILGLLQELTRSRRSGVLAIHASKFAGKICFDSGRICDAMLDKKDELMPEALREILRMAEDSFKFSLRWQNPGSMSANSIPWQTLFTTQIHCKEKESGKWHKTLCTPQLS